MRGSLLALLLVSACYSPSFSTGAPCTTDSECPDTQKCIALACNYQSQDGSGSDMIDASINSTADRDKDGVADGADNCPDLANADQSNVDGDATGDACDRCAQVADTGADADADGVGDACDPNPTTKDAVWLFDPLHALPTAWAPTTNWTLTGGVVQLASRGNTGDDDEYAYPQFTPQVSPVDNFSVTVVFKPTLLTGTANDHSLGFEIWDINNKRGVDCGIDQGSSGSGIVFLEEYNTTGRTGNLSKSAPFGWSVNNEYRVVETRHGTMYSCLVVGPGGAMASVNGTSSVVPRDGVNHSVWGFGVTAQVRSLAVIGAHP